MRNEGYSTDKYEAAFTYEGDDLGMQYSKGQTKFRVWAPSAEQIEVCLYKTGSIEDCEIVKTLPMAKSEKGTWIAEVTGDWNGTYYTYKVKHENGWRETQDPYAVSAGVNGLRSMVLDMESTNPEGWKQDHNPNQTTGLGDAIIYEAHVRDYTIGQDSGVMNKGKYLGLTEEGTHTATGNLTGLSYLKDLGITHLHLLPIYDYGSVDETNPEQGYNWGYDPVNYNVPEGSYATDPYHGEVRVRELKQMIQALHKNGISVIMDVVYNHVYEADNFCINCLEPGYFSRIQADGTYSNGTGCGNDTATERSMVRKYVVDSVLYWTREYHIDGFRFDLVGLIDTTTINEIVKQVHQIRPDVIFYGEGWDMATGLTKKNVSLATQNHAWQTPGFAYFNDSIRDTLKGSIAAESAPGYITGEKHQTDAVKSNLLGLPFWSSSPLSVVQYNSCHDDLTLFDKIKLTSPDKSEAEQIECNLLAASIVFGSMGTVLFPEGEELLRSKELEDGTICSNSYNAGDGVNAIDWSCLDRAEVKRVQSYYQDLIAMRKNHPALRQKDAKQIRRTIDFKGLFGKEAIIYLIDGNEMKEETAKQICVIFNPEDTSITVPLTDENWEILLAQEKEMHAQKGQQIDGSVEVAAHSALYLMVPKENK